MLGKKRLKSKEKSQDKGRGRGRGKRKGSIKEPIKKGVIKKINDNKYQIEGSQVSYVLKGKGKIKVTNGHFTLSGYIIDQGEEQEFDFTNEINPMFINTITIGNNDNDSNNVIEIELHKGNKDTQIIDLNSNNTSNKPKGIKKANYIPIPNELNGIIEYKTILITGKNNNDKSLYIPIIMNRLLTGKKEGLCLIDFDNSPNSKLAISLILLTKPIMTNSFCSCFPSNTYNTIASIYQNDPNDINQCIQIVQCLIDKAKRELKIDCLLITTPMQKGEMYSALLYKLIQSNNELGNKAVVYIKNQSSNDQDTPLDDIIVNHNQNALIQLMYNGDNNENSYNKDNDPLDVIQIETTYKFNENESIESIQSGANSTIPSLYDNIQCTKLTIQLYNILFCLNDNCYSYTDILSSIDILQMFSNRHCVILSPNEKPSHYTKDSLNYLFLSQIPIQQRNFLSIAKVISIEMKTNSISLYTNSSLSKDKRIVLIVDNRIEKLMKEAKSVKYQKYLSNVLFPYSIINNTESNNMKTKASYLGRNSYNLI